MCQRHSSFSVSDVVNQGLVTLKGELHPFSQNPLSKLVHQSFLSYKTTDFPSIHKMLEQQWMNGSQVAMVTALSAEI